MRTTVLAAGLLVGLVACGHAASPVAGRDAWRGLTWEERHDAMTFRVLPNMSRAFQAFQGKPVADMTCRTCHGENAEQVAYAMPHGLPALDPARMPDPRNDRTARFMTDTVTPLLAVVLEVDRARVSCFTCHPRTP